MSHAQRSSTSRPQQHIPIHPTTVEEHRVLLEHLLCHTVDLGTEHGLNGVCVTPCWHLPIQSTAVVAFSGGVDSSLVAWLAHSSFDDSAVAALGVSPSLPPDQRDAAHSVAEYIGIELLEVPTNEGSVPGYIANDGHACFHCKVALYSTLRDVGQGVLQVVSLYDDDEYAPTDVVLFNGTNADDLTDVTRVGLVAAEQYRVASPLAGLPKATVRALARHVGLPNWDWAASPCLRSRLQVGVPADARLLEAVGAAEAAVRGVLGLGVRDSMRVRVLVDGAVVVWW